PPGGAGQRPARPALDRLDARAVPRHRPGRLPGDAGPVAGGPAGARGAQPRGLRAAGLPGQVGAAGREGEFSMSVEAGLLRDIGESPEDAPPRLVLADWLSDQDAPAEVARGEFVRVQLTLAGLSPRDPRRADLQRREQELREQYERAWLGPLADVALAWSF